MKGDQISINITSGSIIKSILFGLLIFLLWYLRDIVLVVLSAIVIASAVEPAIRYFMRHGLNRLLSVILIYLLIGGIFFSILFFFVPPILNDAATFLKQLPATLSSINISDTTHGLLPWSVTNNFSSADLLQNISTTISNTTGGVFSTVSAFFGGLTSFVLIVVFSIYFSVQETGVDDFLRIVTPAHSQVYVLNLWKRSQEKIGKWMQGQLILAAIIGVLLYLGLVILGVPHALLLSLIAAAFELIPVFGQFLAAVPAVAVAFGDGGVTEALLVAGLYIVIQQFEAHLIYPVVVKKVVGIPPLLVILSLLIGFKLVGFLGVLLSVPIAGAVQEIVSDIDKQKTKLLARQGFTPDGEAK
ncbi:MAG TPA: AI-2E family transporter [Candidatus Paceibacterota bacterium]